MEVVIEQTEIMCDGLDQSIEEHKKRGFRLDMIFPADSPREALMSKGGELVRLKAVPPALAGGGEPEHDPNSFSQETLIAREDFPPAHAGGSDFVRGRAGMEYRDLIPGRLGGKLIASHIRLPFGGEVPDSVHYHKIDFQMIYCVRGRIEVVYEDQGPPFWLESGDCILQPPEIRHRVLYSEAGAEVIEVSSPAEHETWIDHEMELPNPDTDRNRLFGGQRFVHSRAEDADWALSGFGGYERRKTDIENATGGLIDVQFFRSVSERTAIATSAVTEPGKGILICLEDGGSILLEFLR